MKKMTGLDIYRFVSVLALAVVGLLFVLDSIHDMGVHSFPQLLIVITLKCNCKFCSVKKEKIDQFTLLSAPHVLVTSILWERKFEMDGEK